MACGRELIQGDEYFGKIRRSQADNHASLTEHHDVCVCVCVEEGEEVGDR